MQTNRIAGLGVLVVLCALAGGQLAQQRVAKPTLNHRPFPGFVPDEETACSIAAAMLRPILGPSDAKEYYFSASLNGNVWTVKSHLRPQNDDSTGPDPTFKIAKDNGAVIELKIPPG